MHWFDSVHSDQVCPIDCMHSGSGALKVLPPQGAWVTEANSNNDSALRV